MENTPARLLATLGEQYRVQRELGAGGMAVVYLADDLKHHRQVAIKVLRPELAAALGADRFLAEIRTTAGLQHPHILPLYDSGEAGDSLYYVMPFIDGESLRDRLDREGSLPREDALHIARQVADALSYAHARNVIHRDIKPENILLSGGHAYVADFGIARALRAAAGATRITQTGTAVGTPAYMSPEQAFGEDGVDHRTDLYSLGCLVYEMLTGKPPFVGSTPAAILARRLTLAPPRISAQRTDLPGSIDAAVYRAMAREAGDRFASVAQFVEALAPSSATAPSAQQSVAVLPFANMSAEPSVVCSLLIGREAPLSAGFHALDRAWAAHGSTVLVSGEAGIGKSRFVRALVERARAAGFLTLQGACFEADRAHPYAPLLDLVRGLALTTSPALAAHAFGPAGTELVTLFPELRSIFPEVASREALDPEEGRRRLFHSFTEAVHALGGVQPVLMVIEDVQWSDDASLDLMLHLARRISSERIALVLTFRSDEVGPRLSRLLAEFDRARCASEVGLRPLGVPEVSAMLQSIFDSNVAFGTPFVAALHSLTEGNPFFIEEMLKALLVSGDLARTDGTWRARPLENIHVPRTATEAVDRRLADLSAAAGRVASIAAVAGRRVDFGRLQAVTQLHEPELLSLVKELVEAQLVVEESADRFAFRHALTREAIRTRLLARERIPLHRAIADALERDYDEATGEGDDALAYHNFEAGEWEPARQFALRAATRALALSAPREALQHFDRAATATANAGGRPDSALLVGRGRAHEILGAFQQANDNFVAALGAARESREPRREWVALHALGLLWAARDYERAGQYRRDALDVARTLDDPLLVARSLNRVGNWFVNREDPQSGIPHHEEALAIFERAADDRGVAETVDLLAMAHHIAGAQETAAQLYERSIGLFTSRDDRRGLVNALSVLAVCGPSHHASAGPVLASSGMDELLATERPVGLATEIGWRAGEAFSRYLLADCLAWRGEYQRALRLARESLVIAQEIDHLEWQCGARRVLGIIALYLFDLTEARSQLEAAHDIALRLGSATWIRWTGAPLAVALARGEHGDEAQAILDAVDRAVHIPAANGDIAMAGHGTLGERDMTLARAELALAADAPARVLALVGDREVAGTPRAALLKGQALVALERWGEATTMLDLARKAARQQGALPLLWRIDALQGAVHLGERRRLEARQSFDSARAIAGQLVAGLDEPVLVTAFQAGVDRLAPPSPARTARQAAKAAHGGLTRRERDTAALIADGMANRAIARTLGIGERTVEGYVASALAKLGFSSRSQLAVWAAKQGLVRPNAAPGRPRR